MQIPYQGIIKIYFISRAHSGIDETMVLLLAQQRQLLLTGKSSGNIEITI